MLLLSGCSPNMFHETPKREVDDDDDDEESSKPIAAGVVPCGQTLHEDIVIEILTCMTAKCLLRMKSVCKRWCFLIQERNFIEKQMGKVKTFYCFHNRLLLHGRSEVETFRMLCGFDGLCLVKSNRSDKYFIRNDEIRQILELPEPPCDNNTLGSNSLSYVPTTGEYKWVCMYSDQPDQRNQKCEILTLGNDQTWRPLTMPDLDYSAQIGIPVVVSVGKAIHCIRVLEVDRSNLETQITTLDLQTETFSITISPKGLFSDCLKACPMIWNGCLAFAEREREYVVVTMLEDYKKRQWSKDKIRVPLTFIKDLSADEIDNLVILLVMYDEMWFRLKDDKIIVYDIRTLKVKFNAEAGEGYAYSKTACFVSPPSMVTLKGMQPYATRSTFTHATRSIR